MSTGCIRGDWSRIKAPWTTKRPPISSSQAADGLAHAHESGFVHRDVKPANLLVDSNGVLKILDLGLARFTFEGEDAWHALDGEQSAVGTADYVAPGTSGRQPPCRRPGTHFTAWGSTFYYLFYWDASLSESDAARVVDGPQDPKV